MVWAGDSEVDTVLQLHIFEFLCLAFIQEDIQA